MKKVILANVLICLLSLIAFGQTGSVKRDLSKLEKFSAKSGSLIEKKVY